jgi:hypothetical protein
MFMLVSLKLALKLYVDPVRGFHDFSVPPDGMAT